MTVTPSSPKTAPYSGTDRDIIGLICAAVTFWLFGQTFLNVGPMIGKQVGMPDSVTTIAVSMGSLVCGMLIVMWGGLADSIGRMKILFIGNICNIIGSVLIACAMGGETAATAMILTGRVFHGLAGGAITPNILAIGNTFWKGDKRARAISFISMGTFGGLALSSSVGGLIASSPLGWRSIFIISTLFSVLSILLLRNVPENKAERTEAFKPDIIGITSLALSMIGLQLFISQGGKIGWTSPIILGFAGLFLVAGIIFIITEKRVAQPLVNFSVFKSRTFTGAVSANFFMTTTAGIISVALWVLQNGANISPATSGYLTLGYAFCLLAFIRVGEKVMKKKGFRFPMILGTLIVLVSIISMMFTGVLASQYMVIVAIAFALYGFGLAMFATPSTTAALTSLSPNMVGAGSGVFKMASSLGSAIGIALAATIFATMQTTGTFIIGRVIKYSGRQDNIAVRDAAAMAFGVEAIFCIFAIVCIWVFIRNLETQTNMTKK